MRIEKDFHFSMGHALAWHEGKCHRPHGHNYKMWIEVTGDVDPETDMVLDFYYLDKAVAPMVEYFDHNFFYNELDDRPFMDVGAIAWQKTPYWMDICGNEPTAENMAILFFHAVQKSLLQQGVEKAWVSRVIVQETLKCRAEYQGGES